MWNKIKGLITATAGVLTILAALLVIAILGVFVVFVGYFFLWGILGFIILFVIALAIYDLIAND